MEMSIDQEGVPKEFKRGQTLEFVLELPQRIPANWFDNGTTISTELEAKLRLAENAGEAGFIADLNPEWEDGSDFTEIRFLVEDTSEFPLGLAEFDVKFTKTKTGTGAYVKTFISNTLQFRIVDGVR